jgi:hypothetical protein
VFDHRLSRYCLWSQESFLHKRREEASKEAKREIETEKCIPGLKRSFDYEVLPEIG